MKISIATEDILTEELMVKVITSKGKFEILHKLGRQGCGFLFKKLSGFNEIAKGHVVFVVFDLDMKPSCEDYKRELEGYLANKSDLLHILISVREVESWILADRVGLGGYFNISKDKIEREPEQLLDPKEKIIYLARSSKNSDIKKGIPPKQGAAAKVGVSYNTLLTKFIWHDWDLNRAIDNSPSLRKVCELLDTL